jgi:hypothetical protein
MRGLGQGGETDKPELCSGRGDKKLGVYVLYLEKRKSARDVGAFSSSIWRSR